MCNVNRRSLCQYTWICCCTSFFIPSCCACRNNVCETITLTVRLGVPQQGIMFEGHRHQSTPKHTHTHGCIPGLLSAVHATQDFGASACLSNTFLDRSGTLICAYRHTGGVQLPCTRTPPGSSLCSFFPIGKSYLTPAAAAAAPGCTAR